MIGCPKKKAQRVQKRDEFSSTDLKKIRSFLRSGSFVLKREICSNLASVKSVPGGALWEVPRTWHKPTKAVSITSLCKLIFCKRGCCVIHLRVGWCLNQNNTTGYTATRHFAAIWVCKARHNRIRNKWNKSPSLWLLIILLVPKYKISIHLKFYLRLPRYPCIINILSLVALLSSRSHNTRIHTTIYFLFGAHFDSREHRLPLTPNCLAWIQKNKVWSRP